MRNLAAAVVVDGERWHQVDSLAGSGPDDRNYIASTDDDGRTTISFGDGLVGARPPSNASLVAAVYRTGIGGAVNPPVDQIALVDLLAYLTDALSREQDATATEAYLETARRRVSVTRHAELGKLLRANLGRERICLCFEPAPRRGRHEPPGSAS